MLQKARPTAVFVGEKHWEQVCFSYIHIEFSVSYYSAGIIHLSVRAGIGYNTVMAVLCAILALLLIAVLVAIPPHLLVEVRAAASSYT